MRIRIGALLCATLLAASWVTPATAESNGPVVSQVYGGGGNAHAAYARDFVELFNRSKTAVDLARWKVQYAPSTSDRWVSTALTGTIAPYRYYLVGLDGGSSGGSALPPPDATGSTNLSGAAGKVRILDGAGATVDLVGYGADTAGAEGRPAPATSDSRRSTARRRGGCMDTDTNASDFEVGTVKPHNHSSAYTRCDAPPSLNTVGNQAVHADSLLTFTLTAFDPDGDALTYSASSLPSGATFYPDSRTFSWRPSSSQVGTYPGVQMNVSDGFSTDSETITVGVAPRSEPGPSSTTVHVLRTDTELTMTGLVSPDHRGFTVFVRLFQRTGPGRYQLVAEQRPILDARSTYRASFARTLNGACIVRARFQGDDLHDTSVGVAQFQC